MNGYFDPNDPYAENPTQTPPPAGNILDADNPSPRTPQDPQKQKSQLAQMAALMSHAGYRGSAAPMAVPNDTQDPKSPLMQKAEDENKPQQQSGGASAGDISSLLEMLA